MTNQELKLKDAGEGVKLWQISEKLGMADCSFSLKLRRELPDEEKERILAIIEELKKEVK